MYKKILSLLVCFVIIIAMSVSVLAKDQSELSWKNAEEILTHISDPIFPDYTKSIEEFGAIPNDDVLDTNSIQAAIDAVSEAGGGKVIVPSGTFNTGAIQLKSNVNLCLENDDSILLYTTEINETNYPVVYSHWEATPIYNYSALIYAIDEENIALTGKGTLNAQSNNENVWWNWRKKIKIEGTNKTTELQSAGQSKTRDDNNNGVPVQERVYGDGWYLRPNFIQTIRCKNVLFEGVTLIDSPMWQVNPVLCENVTVRGMTLKAHGYNTDCVDPESCNYVLIEGNYFDSGDDCIAIKSGRDRDGRELATPCQNIIIINNKMSDGHGGIAMGSEMSGSIYNVFASDNHFDSPNLTYPIRLKTNAKRGGEIANVYLRNSTIDNVDQAVIHGTMLYAEGRIGSYMPAFRNIVIENVNAHGGLYGIFLEAFEESPITGLVLRNVNIDGVKNPIRAMNWADDVIMDNVSINGVKYPSPTETRILGIPYPGEVLKASAELIGGKKSELNFRWTMSESIDGNYTTVAEGDTYTVPINTQNNFLKLVASNENGTTESIPYKILPGLNVCGFAENDKNALIAARLATRGIIDSEQKIDAESEVTRMDVARMLYNLWGMTEPSENSLIADMDPSSEDFVIAACVVENNMIALNKYLNSNLTDVNATNTEMKAFNPNEPIRREEMGTIVMMSCGVSYKNASTTYDTSYADGQDISNVNLTDVERGTALGFWTRSDDNCFRPSDNMTWEMTLDVMNRVADFAGK